MTKKFPENYRLGETVEEVQLDSVEENKQAAIALATQARHSIDIFTQDMDDGIYNNEDFSQAIFILSKKHPNTKIRILVQDSAAAVRNGHRLIRLAQQLTSSVFIHQPSQEYRHEHAAFLLADQVGLLYRANASHRNYHASVNFMAAQRASKLSEFFNEVWEHSTPDMQTRRVYM